jgi:leucyl-tRNA synthetase
MRLAVQVNGKLRGTLELAQDTSEASIRAQALALPPVAKHVENKTVKAVIVVPGRIVSIVAE